MATLEEYYGKFNEEKRLLRPYGRVEYLTTMHYIEEAIGGRENLSILDVGAGTGRYAVPLSEAGHDVTAVELVNYNLGILKQKGSDVKAFKGNALKLKKFPDESFDIVLELGPLYHLFTKEERIRALKEGKRKLKKGGIMLIAYCMNEFSVLTYGFKEGHIKECVEQGLISADFHNLSRPEDLYYWARLSDIDELNEEAGLKRIKIISSDGPANYLRREISAMDEETFDLFMKYQFSICERPELLGAGGHTLDIVRRKEEGELS